MSIEKLKALIKAQLQKEVTQNGDFDVGYLQGSNIVSIRTKEDLLEIWASFQKGVSTILWCDGLKKACQKRPRHGDFSSGDESDDFPLSKVAKKRKKDEEKEDRVEATIKNLKEKNGVSTYTQMQYRIWAEMIIGGVHADVSHAPTSTMFIRAGGGVKKKDSNSATAVSPAKAIDSRSKCYKQLSDLKNLFESGILSNQEYSDEKAIIMGTLKRLV